MLGKELRHIHNGLRAGVGTDIGYPAPIVLFSVPENVKNSKMVR
jgi:hypothetical protein